MIPEIAVMLASDGNTTTLTGDGEVMVYTKSRCQWELDRKMSFSLDHNKVIAEIRKSMQELVIFLGECRIFVTRAASGAIFFELEKAQCSVWEISGRPEEFLDEVWLEEEGQNMQVSSGSIDIPIPVEITLNHFYVSIKDIQGKHPEVSSKQILQKFIRTGAYEKLELICDHVPPWIALESSCCGFIMETVQLGTNEMRVVLIKTQSHGSGCM